MMDLYPLMRPFAFALSPEKAHSLTLTALKTGLLRLSSQVRPEALKFLQTEIAGVKFANPIGIAAGFDKNAEVIDAVFQLGFGATEIGTVTPRPQPGNPKPRLFRLIEDQAVINRMGFNNSGYDAVYARLAKRKADILAKYADKPSNDVKKTGVLGVNIGANKDSTDRISDYVAGLQKFYSVADYFTANISSPNTPGLRNLQNKQSLQQLLSALAEASAAEAKKFGFKRPIFLKIAPDLTEADLDDVAEEFSRHPLDGLIVTNTTISRPALKDQKQATETGGLSGAPLFDMSTTVLAKMRQRLGANIPLIGVGGVSDGTTALAKIQAGADIVQIYSGLVYQGPWMVGRIINDLANACRRQGVNNINSLRDTEVEKWANRSL